jgi:hypothetical protein
MELVPGLAGEVEIVVAPPDTADAHGNPGVHTPATPRLIALLEDAAITAVQAQRLVRLARRRHGRCGRFLAENARRVRPSRMMRGVGRGVAECDVDVVVGPKGA